MRNIEIRSQVRLYGQHDPDMPRSNYLVGYDPHYGRMASMPSTYGHPGLAADLSYRLYTSAMVAVCTPTRRVEPHKTDVYLWIRVAYDEPIRLQQSCSTPT